MKGSKSHKNLFKQELWHDLDSNKHFIIKGGEKTEVDSEGKKKGFFAPYNLGTKRSNEKISIPSKNEKGNLPLIAIKTATNSSAVSSIVKLSGYSQFPRPVSYAFFNVQQEPRSDKKKISCALKELKEAKVRAIYNKSPLQEKNYSIESCTFLDARRKPKSLSRNNSVTKSSAKTYANPPSNYEGSSVDSSYFRQKETLNQSTLKTRFLEHIKDTFVGYRNLKGFSEEKIGFLTKEPIVEEEEIYSTIGKTFQDIKKDVKRQTEERDGYKYGKEQPLNLSSKGIYNLHIPSEGELFGRSKDFKMKVNPIAYEEEKKREELDKKILQKRREQRIIKNIAMQSVIRAKEKEFLRERMSVDKQDEVVFPNVKEKQNKTLITSRSKSLPKC